MPAMPADQPGQAELIAPDRDMSRLADGPRHLLGRGRHPASLDLVEGIHDGVEGQKRRGVPRLEVAHGLEDAQVLPFPPGASPFSFSIRRMACLMVRSSSAVEPTTWRAMIEEEACPSAQAFTSWAKSVTTPSSTLRSTVTVEPHSLE